MTKEINNTKAVAKANKAIQAFCDHNFFDVEIEEPVSMLGYDIVKAKLVYGTTEYQVILNVWNVNFLNGGESVRVVVSARSTKDNGHESMTRIKGRLDMMENLSKGVKKGLEIQGFTTTV